jgi:hypothetical protein
MVGVHIRGTDKFKNPGKRTLGVQYAAVNAVMNGALNGAQMVVVSDDTECLKIWKNYFPHSVLLSDISLQTSSLKGNHNLSKEEQLNVDLLVDFFTLALTNRIVATNRDSRFSQEASRLHSVVHKILEQ